VPLFRRATQILRACEELRQASAFDENAKAKLREPGSEFTLFTNATGQVRFRRSHTTSHTAAVAEPWSLAWNATNMFETQPIRFRIEALMSAEPPNDTNTIVLADFSKADAVIWKRTNAEGIQFDLTSESPAPERGRQETNPVTAQETSQHSLPPNAKDPGSTAPAETWATLIATNSGRVARNASWARLERRFDPPLNLKKHQALGVWIDGDGSGEIVAIRLESPRHIAFRAIADRYITVEFVGPRFVTLVETESTRWSDYTWNDGKGLYNVYRETIDFGVVEFASVWLQNLPPGRQTECRLGPIVALPMAAATLHNPVLDVNGNRIKLPVELTSGGWIECNGSDRFTSYGPNGETLAVVKLSTPLPFLLQGNNQLQLSCDPQPLPSPRVKVTVFSQGESL